MVLKNFIVFEGIDGSGTSTQMRILEGKSAAGKLFLTSEPTKGPTGIFLRQMLSGRFPLDPRTAAYLFAADRNEHMYGPDGILKNIQSGKIVISDRYVFSSLAYQSIECGKELPYMLNREFPLPQLLFFFDAEPEITLARIKTRSTTEIHTPRTTQQPENRTNLKNTTDAYRSVISDYQTQHTGMEIVRLDAAGSIEKTAQIIWSYIEKLPILKP